MNTDSNLTPNENATPQRRGVPTSRDAHHTDAAAQPPADPGEPAGSATFAAAVARADDPLEQGAVRRSSQRSHSSRNRSHASGSRFSRDASGRVIAADEDGGRYASSADNPYLSSGGADARFSRIDSGFLSAGGMGSTQARTKRKKHHLRNFLLLLLLIAAGFGAYYVYKNFMPVQVKVEGQRRSFTRGTTLEQILAEEGLSFLPGNYITVGGDVVTEGEGNPWSVTVNGEKLSFEDAKAYGVTGGEVLDYDNGDDIMEPYDVEIRETQPKLVMDGEWGAITYISSWGRVDRREIRTGRESGQVAEGDILQEGSDCVLAVRNVNPSGQKLIALTFDDGPSAYTERYLDILDRYGAKATFFMLGENIDDMPEVAADVVRRGHQVANHSYSHEEYTMVDAQVVRDQLTRCYDSINSATGVDTTVIRPPYGSMRQSTWHETEGLVSVSVLWNMDSEDWKMPGVDQIVTNSTATIENGYIILMHDGGGNRDQDLEALPLIIERMQSRGYKFVTIDELLASDPSIPEDIASGNATMPEDCIWPAEIG